MALRNFPHADANGDGMLNAAEMERAVDESEVAQAQLRSRYSRL